MGTSNIFCHGRNSGCDHGWMMFEDKNGNPWEELAHEWEEVLDLSNGKNYFRRKSDGLIALPILPF